MAGSTTGTSSSGQQSLATELRDAIDRIKALEQEKSNTGPRLKIGKVEPFSGASGTLDRFLTQMSIYFSINIASIGSESDKVLAASSFLTGDAMHWFAPYVEN